MAQMVKHLPAMQKTQVQFLGQEDPLEKGMATHFSILVWKILCTEAGRLSMGCKKADTTERLTHMFESGRRELIQEGSEIFKSTLHRTLFFFECLVSC